MSRYGRVRKQADDALWSDRKIPSAQLLIGYGMAGWDDLLYTELTHVESCFWDACCFRTCTQDILDAWGVVLCAESPYLAKEAVDVIVCRYVFVTTSNRSFFFCLLVSSLNFRQKNRNGQSLFFSLLFVLPRAAWNKHKELTREQSPWYKTRLSVPYRWRWWGRGRESRLRWQCLRWG